MAKKTGKDLLEAAERIDYDGILACLEDGVPGSYVEPKSYVKVFERSSPVARILASVNKPEFSSNNAAACIKLLHEHGADLNYRDNGGFPLDYVEGIYTDDFDERRSVQRNMYNAVAYVLTHGGRQTRKEISVSDVLAYQGVMGNPEFHRLTVIGETYRQAQELGVEFDVDNAGPKEYDKIDRLLKIHERESDLRNGNGFDAKHFVMTRGAENEDGKLYSTSKDEVWYFRSLSEIEKVKAYLDKMNKIVARDEKNILDELKKLEAEKAALLGTEKPKTPVRSRLKKGEASGGTTAKPNKQK